MTLPAEFRVDAGAVTQEVVDLLSAEVAVADLAPESDLLGNGLDSLKVMSLVFKLEAKYDIHLDEEDADELRTVSDLVSLVISRIEEVR